MHHFAVNAEVEFSNLITFSSKTGHQSGPYFLASKIHNFWYWNKTCLISLYNHSLLGEHLHFKFQFSVLGVQPFLRFLIQGVSQSIVWIIFKAKSSCSLKLKFLKQTTKLKNYRKLKTNIESAFWSFCLCFWGVVTLYFGKIAEKVQILKQMTNFIEIITFLFSKMA